MYKLEKRLRPVQMRWDFHLENVRTETRTRHISSVISLYTFQYRIVMMIMGRILVLVDDLQHQCGATRGKVGNGKMLVCCSKIPAL